MKAIVLTQQQGVKRLELAELPIPAPKADEVRIRVQAIGFNPSDIQMMQAAALDALPLILGGQVSGIVAAVGADVTSLRVGDPVYAYLPIHRSGYAEYVCVNACFAARRPRALSPVVCAGVPVAALTAYQALLAPTRFGVQLRPGESVFIAGGAGGVGTFAVQMARAACAIVIISTAGSDRSAHYLEHTLGLGPKQIIRYAGLSHDALREHVLAANGGAPVDVALDCVGGAMTRLCCAVIGLGGAVLSIVNGPTDARSTDSDEDVLFSKMASFHFVLAYARAQYGDPRRWPEYQRELDAVTRLIEDGAIAVIPVTEVGGFSVETVQQAHQQLESGHTQGKLVMRVE
jgi:NADPH:quinone reductase-like Zn-dependent oxidoreductase